MNEVSLARNVHLVMFPVQANTILGNSHWNRNLNALVPISELRIVSRLGKTVVVVPATSP